MFAYKIDLYQFFTRHEIKVLNHWNQICSTKLIRLLASRLIGHCLINTYFYFYEELIGDRDEKYLTTLTSIHFSGNLEGCDRSLRFVYKSRNVDHLFMGISTNLFNISTSHNSRSNTNKDFCQTDTFSYYFNNRFFYGGWMAREKHVPTKVLFTFVYSQNRKISLLFFLF